MKTPTFNEQGQRIGEVELNDKIFGLTKIDSHLVHFVLRAQRNNSRRAIAHTKNRGEVSGGGKKPWKQKGTGRARAGSIRSPLWRGGGVTFGPRSDRNFSIKVNQQTRSKALFNVLSDKAKAQRLIIIENFDPVAKTAELAKKLQTIAQKANLGKKYLLVLPNHNKALAQASKNLPNAKVITAKQLNVFDLLKYDPLIVKEALPIIEQTFLKSPSPFTPPPKGEGGSEEPGEGN